MVGGASDEQLHERTPLVRAQALSELLDADVRLKLDNLQPTGSFKIRGIGRLCASLVRDDGCAELVSSSGGNAGMAAAYAGRELGVPTTVFVPETTPELTRTRLRALGARVVVSGTHWAEANEAALAYCRERDGRAGMVHPFDGERIWAGHATIVHELREQLGGRAPDAIVTVVGGGGLLCGLVQGCRDVGWTSVPVIAAETRGADSFACAVAAGELVTLPGIKSLAKTLGAVRVCAQAFVESRAHPVHSVVVDDLQALDAVERFLDEERLLVELSCGAGLACVYAQVPELRARLDEARAARPDVRPLLVIEVCGGSLVSRALLQEWRAALTARA